MEEGIWQVDPTGQFWKCRVAVAGRGANKARKLLLEMIAAHLNATNSEISHRQLQQFMDHLSVEDAVKFASECLQSSTSGTSSSIGNETEATTLPARPIVAFSIRKLSGGEQEVRWYSRNDLIGDSTDETIAV